MSEHLIIGGKSGLGLAIVNHYSISNVLSRPDFDISTPSGIQTICAEVKRAAPSIVFLNARSVIKPSAQLDLLEALWNECQAGTTFVIISSYARYYAGLEVGDEGFQVYAKAKKELSETAARMAYNGQHKVVIIEPSYVLGGVPHNMVPYLTIEEFLEMIDHGLELSKNSQVVTITRVGVHR